MNHQEYENKKRECWEEYVDMLNRNCATRYMFDKIFDRAYALGKQTETITQEEIHSAGVEYSEREYYGCLEDGEYTHSGRDVLNAAESGFIDGANFALGKQEKDAEGEEMLMVPRKKVQEKWQRAYEQEEQYRNAVRNPIIQAELYYNRGIMSAIDTLFGSKCLPELSEVKRDLSGNLSEQKPEPQFSVGNWVRVISTDKQGCTGEIIEVEIDEDGIRYQISGVEGWHFLEKNLVPYTEPQDYSLKSRISPEQTPSDSSDSSDNSDSSDPCPSRNLSQNIADCDKQLDNILKDSFRNERRLNIATQMASAYISSEGMTDPSLIATISFQLADALMAKAERRTL